MNNVIKKVIGGDICILLCIPSIYKRTKCIKSTAFVFSLD